MKNMLIAAFILALLPIIAHAGNDIKEPKDPDDCLKDDLCHAQYKLARELSKSGQLPEALIAYENAYQRRAIPLFLFNIARLHHRLGHLSDAVSYYSRYLETQLLGEAEQRSRARQYLEDATRQLQNASIAMRNTQPASGVDTEEPPPAQAGAASTAGPGQPTPANATSATPSNPPKTDAATTPAQRSTAASTPGPTSLAPATAPIAAAALPDQGAERKPIYKRWWLWTIVGTAVAATTVGLGVGLGYKPGGSTTPTPMPGQQLPTGINTYEPNF